MTKLDESQKIRDEIEQVTAKTSDFNAFYPVYQDLIFNLKFLEERPTLTLKEMDIFFRMAQAYSVGFERGKKAKKPTKWQEYETYEFNEYWQLYQSIKNQVLNDFYRGKYARDSREFSAIVARRMYEAGQAGLTVRDIEPEKLKPFGMLTENEINRLADRLNVSISRVNHAVMELARAENER